MSMKKRDRVLAALRGLDVDRPPVALWRHFPSQDQDAAALARAHLDFQMQYDWDFIKVTEAGSYPGEDWGATTEYRESREGARSGLDSLVKEAGDWCRLPLLDVHQGVYGRELHTLRLVRAGCGPDIHVMPTIFGPLSAAKYLGRNRLLDDLRNRPADLHAGLQVIAHVTANFARACLESGADAIYFATQFASQDVLSEAEYREFGVPYDRMVLEAAAGKADFVLLHAHGKRPMFDLLADYPVQAINWHDRAEPPSLAEGQRRFAGAVAGGIDEWDTLQAGPDQVSAQAREAIAQTGGRRFILAAGCVIPMDTPDANIRAVRQAVEI